MADPWLPTEHGTDNQNLQRRVARGVTWTIVDNWGRQFLQLAVFIVIANLLLPEEFGLVALAMIFVMLAQLFVDQGMGDALVQRGHVAREHLDTAFWAAMLLGSLLAVSTILLAGVIGGLLNEPGLAPLLQVLSLSFILTAAAAVPMAMLRREMRFRSLALRTLFSIAGGGVVGMALAVMGFGPWALVGQQVTAAALSVVALWLATGWRPSRRFSGQHFRELFGFGARVVASDLLLYITRYTDNLLIGVFRTTQELGIYAVGYRILDSANSLLVGIARKITFPALSRLQHDPERAKRAYFRVTRLSATLILPAYVGLALVAPELIPLVFGAQWTDSGPVAAVLFLVGPAYSFQGFGTSLLMAAGRPDVVLRFRFVNMVTTVIGFAIAVPFGIVAMAISFVIRGYLMVPYQLYLQRRYAGIPSGEYLRRLIVPTTATVAMALAVIGIRLLLDEMAVLPLLAVSVVTGAVVYIAAIVIMDRPLVGEVLSVASQALPGGERARRRLGRGGSGRRAPAAPDAGEPATPDEVDVSRSDRPNDS
jgi:O-antigen/teichoic acid export membrane protein